MNITTLIVDDEAAARSRLRKLLAAFPDITIAGEARDGAEAVALIGRTSAELVFLDVQMPGLDGFEVLKALPAGTRWPLVVFATAFDRYALAAFEANAVGYLLKPINRERLSEAIDRVAQLIGTRGASSERERLRALTASRHSAVRHIVGRLRDRYVLIPIEDVCLVRVEDGLAQVKTRATWYPSDYTLSDLEARLPSPPFFRAHRSTLVNARYIKEVVPMIKGSYVLVMKDQEGTEVPVSERQSNVVRRLLEQ